MTNITDPYQALVSFQQALVLGNIELQPGAIDPELFVARDAPNGRMRLTYVRLDGLAVTALATIVHAEPMNECPCFQIGYAVAESYRRQGRVTETVRAAFVEMQQGFKRAGISTFYVEAVIGASDAASNGVARRILSATPDPVTDSPSGEPAFHYIRKFEI